MGQLRELSDKEKFPKLDKLEVARFNRLLGEYVVRVAVQVELLIKPNNRRPVIDDRDSSGAKVASRSYAPLTADFTVTLRVLFRFSN